jgi:hypothetical protein
MQSVLELLQIIVLSVYQLLLAHIVIATYICYINPLMLKLIPTAQRQPAKIFYWGF